jgi:hypothetical protein
MHDLQATDNYSLCRIRVKSRQVALRLPRSLNCMCVSMCVNIVTYEHCRRCVPQSSKEGMSATRPTKTPIAQVGVLQHVATRSAVCAQLAGVNCSHKSRMFPNALRRLPMHQHEPLLEVGTSSDKLCTSIESYEEKHLVKPRACGQGKKLEEKSSPTKLSHT